jgi:hypothetical protein
MAFLILKNKWVIREELIAKLKIYSRAIDAWLMTMLNRNLVVDVNNV